jgi:hypothetical protein
MKITFDVGIPDPKRHSVKYTQVGDTVTVTTDGVEVRDVPLKDVFEGPMTAYVPAPFGKRGKRQLRFTIEEL